MRMEGIHRAALRRMRRDAGDILFNARRLAIRFFDESGRGVCRRVLGGDFAVCAGRCVFENPSVEAVMGCLHPLALARGGRRCRQLDLSACRWTRVRATHARAGLSHGVMCV